MKSTFTFICILLLVLLIKPLLYSQSVGIGTTSFTPDTKSILEIKGSQLGLLIPRMTWANRPSGLNATQDGLLIFSTDGDGTNGKGFYYWDGTTLTWKKLFSGNTADYILNQSVNNVFTSGQTASFDITGNGEINGTFNVKGNVGIGMTSDSAKLEVAQNNAIKIGRAYLSSGGDYVHLSNNEWYNGSSWVQTAAGALFQLNGQSFYFYSHPANGVHTKLGLLNNTGFQLAPANSYFNFDSVQGSAGFGFRDSSGVIEYKHGGGIWTAFSQPPTIPGNTEWWVRPDSANYIQPIYNALARVYDNYSDYGFYYEGSNSNGGLFHGGNTGAIGTRSSSSDLCSFTSDQYPFKDIGGDFSITSADQLTWSGLFGYGASYNGITGIGELDCGVRGIGLGTSSNAGTNAYWPVIGVIGEVIQTGTNYGQQGIYGWQAAHEGSGNYDAGVLGRTSQSGTQSGGVIGYYTPSVGNLITCFSASNYGLLGTANYGGEFSNGLRLYPGAPPMPLMGAMYYDDGDNTLYYFNGSAWKAAVSDNLGNHIATSALDMNSNDIANISEVYNNGWFRNNNAGTGLYNQSTGSGIFSPAPNLMTLYNASSLQITSASTPSGNLRFDDPNPYISASSFFIAPGGAYFNSGTVYTEAAIQARGGINNDGGNFGGDVSITDNMRILGVVTGIQNNYPPNNAIRLTPNLHLNSNSSYATIINWDNGTTGDTPTFRIGNGSGSDIFQVWAGQGNTGINTDPSANFKLTAYDVDMTAGSDYSQGSARCVVEGHDINSQSYEFGTGGWSWNDYPRSGGIIGSQWGAGYWGSLGYKNSAGNGYGGYFTSHDDGAGFMPESNSTGVGSGSYGGIMGSWSRGEVLGFTSCGELYAAYHIGNVYTSGHQAEVVTVGEKRVAAYPVSSTEIKVYSDGKAKLINGKSRVTFDASFAGLIGDNIPVVTISPMGQCNGLFIKNVDSKGFDVEELAGGASNVEFSFIIIGKRIDADVNSVLPEALSDKEFDNNMKRVMFNENNKEKSGTPLWWDGKKLRFGALPQQRSVKKPEVKPIPANNKNNDPTRLWEEQKKKMDQEKPSLNAPKQEDYYPGNADKKGKNDNKTDK